MNESERKILQGVRVVKSVYIVIDTRPPAMSYIWVLYRARELFPFPRRRLITCEGLVSFEEQENKETCGPRPLLQIRPTGCKL